MVPRRKSEHHSAARPVAEPLAASKTPVETRAAERLTPARQHVDLVAIDGRIASLGRIGGETFGIVARVLGDWPAAIALVDGVDATQHFVERFHRTGVPSVWPAGVIVRLDVFALDLAEPETVAKTADQPRGTWLLADAGDELRDPRSRLSSAGARRAARRREGTP